MTYGTHRTVTEKPASPEAVKIIKAGNSDDFTMLINDAIRNGWRPIGNMVVHRSGMYYQMMAKYDEHRYNPGPL